VQHVFFTTDLLGRARIIPLNYELECLKRRDFLKDHWLRQLL
jgi:hypothetical protein